MSHRSCWKSHVRNAFHHGACPPRSTVFVFHYTRMASKCSVDMNKFSEYLWTELLIASSSVVLDIILVSLVLDLRQESIVFLLFSFQLHSQSIISHSTTLAFHVGEEGRELYWEGLKPLSDIQTEQWLRWSRKQFYTSYLITRQEFQKECHRLREFHHLCLRSLGTFVQ